MRYYTRNCLKILTIILLAFVTILTMVGFKYDKVYKVTIADETVGYIDNLKEFEDELKEYISNNEKQIAFIIEENMPKCELLLTSNNVECDKDKVLEYAKNTEIVAYKNYAIVLDGEEKQYVETLEAAQEVVKDIKEEFEKNLELDLGIEEKFTYNTTNTETVEVSMALASIEQDVTEKIRIMGSTVNGVTLKQPITGIITSRYGALSRIRSSAHTGLDIAASTGTAIKAAAPGTVTLAKYNGNYGNLVIIEHENGVETYYAHCSKIYVNVGDEVTTDTTIAAVGSTGNSTGPHLHLEIRVDGETVNPQKYLYKE